MRPSLLLAALFIFSCTPQDASPPVEEPAPDSVNDPDAGEGARAKREEGKTGKKDANLKKAKDRQVAANSGLLGAVGDSTGAVGGLIGAKGEQLGIGGLGTRGGGLGGGGIGVGKSGYGSASGRMVQAARLERYTDYGVNNTVLTEADRHSTFSIDVDTAAYAISRSYLQRGSMPPVASVRVEEFVNAQDYGYVPPDGEAPFSVSMEAAPAPFQPGHHLLRVGVKAAEPELERKPVHLTFLVDVSGSMSAQNKLPLAKRALHELVDNLDGEDRVALVTYAGSTGVVLAPTRLSDKSKVHAAIDGLQRGGGTNMDSGMNLAYDLALKTLEPGTENRIVVLSDGDANIGRSSHDTILKSLEGYAKKGITLSTIGFGNGNYQDTLMEQLANKGDGNYYYIDSFKEAQKVFGTKLTATMTTVARDVKIQVEFDPESVLSYRLIGYENRDIADKDFRNDKVDAGEIGSGHTVTALYDVILSDERAENLATVRVRSKVPGPDAPALENATQLPSAAVQPTFAMASPDFRVAVGTATFAEKLRQSPYVAEVDYDAIRELIESAERGTDAELISLVVTADRLSRQTVARR